MQEQGEDGGRSRDGKPIQDLSPKELREHLGRVVANHPEAAGEILSDATKAVLSDDPESGDVLRGATGVDASDSSESGEESE